MSTAPRVSVLMTLYNKGPFVAEAIQSVLAQSFADFELLLVDDASTDDGPMRAKAIGDPRIHLLESAINTGRPAAANRGYDAARGEYIAVLDADDKMHPERLAKQVAFMEAHPEVGALGSWAENFGGRAGVIKLPAGDRGCRGQMLFGMPVLYPASMIRHQVLREHGLRCNPDWHLPGMDRLFMLDIGQHAEYANLQEVLTYYRVGEQNMRHGRNNAKDMEVLYRELFRRYGIPATDREIALQTALHPDVNPPPPNAREVREIGAWIKRLARYNRDHGLFPVAEFERELDRRWRLLFHETVQHDAWAALTHVWLTHMMRERALDWLKVTKDRMLGRSRS